MIPGHLRAEETVGYVDEQGWGDEKERGQYSCAKAAEDAVVAWWLGGPVVNALLDVGLRLLGREIGDGHGEEQSPHVRVVGPH